MGDPTKQYARSRCYDIASISQYRKTGHYCGLIQCVAVLTNCQSYLELGVGTGISLRMMSNIVPKCVGVDVRDCGEKSGFDFRLTTTDNFFKWNKDTFDIIFIDGDHHFEQVRKDFDNAISILNRHGVILLHDTDPMARELLSPNYCGDAHRVHDYISALDGWNIVTLPVQEMGLSMVMRAKDRRVNQFIHTTE